MKRLTDTRRSRCVFCEAADEECAFAAGEFSAPCPDYKTYQRLSAIEDILGDDYDLDRLKEIVQADRQGKCAVLPCKLGDLIYQIVLNKWDNMYFVSLPEKVVGVGYSKGNNLNKHPQEYIVITPPCLYFPSIIDIEEIGKTVFFTYEEAEAALEKMKEGK